jgi:DNA invertase Pin-like site-specific DNA recombinase
MLVGYARTSTAEQEAGLEAQIRDLRAAGCEEVFSEQVSSVAKRDQLEAALRFVRKGDVLMVAKPDRLARSVADLLAIVSKLEARGIGLRVLSMGGGAGGLDTRDPTQRFTLTLLGAVAEFERGLMLERQREGIAKAKGEGKYKGRKPTARMQADQMRRLKADGHGATAIARQLGVTARSVHRVLRGTA